MLTMAAETAYSPVSGCQAGSVWLPSTSKASRLPFALRYPHATTAPEATFNTTGDPHRTDASTNASASPVPTSTAVALA